MTLKGRLAWPCSAAEDALTGALAMLQAGALFFKSSADPQQAYVQERLSHSILLHLQVASVTPQHQLFHADSPHSICRSPHADLLEATESIYMG